MGWLATHHKLYSFITFNHNCFQTHSQEGNFQDFPGGMPQTLLARTKLLSVVCTLGKLDQHCQKPTSNSGSRMIMLMIHVHERPNLNPKPASHLDIFLDQCLYHHPPLFLQAHMLYVYNAHLQSIVFSGKVHLIVNGIEYDYD